MMGVGDLFVVGFLLGFVCDLSFEDVGKMGVICVVEIIFYFGVCFEIDLKFLIEVGGIDLE